MKNLIWLIVMTVIVSALTGCGKKNTGSLGSCALYTGTGTWKNLLNNDIMVLDSVCHGTTTYCNMKFDYTRQPDGITSVVYTTQTNGGPECLPMGTSVCTFNFSAGNSLIQINCGAATTQYQRQ